MLELLVSHVASFLLHSIAQFGLIIALHAAVLRVSRRVGLLKTSLFCAFVVTVLSSGGALLTGHDFAMTFDAGIAAFFAYQLFFFLGPATADRSCTAHLLMYLGDRREPVTPEASIIATFSGNNFMQKRFEECTSHGLLSRTQGNRLELSPRGRAFAAIYRSLTRLYGIDRRTGWIPSFPQVETRESG